VIPVVPDYADIRSRIAEDPLWYDGAGVPRYEPFHPSMLGVYDDFAIEAEIACASCGATFRVGEGWTRFDLHVAVANPSVTPPERTLAGLVIVFSYGDPPRHDYGSMGRCAGETMCSDVVRIVSGWERTLLGWLQRPEFEDALVES